MINMADTAVMAEWVKTYIEQHPEPNFTVYQHGQVYLQRWYVVPRNDCMNVYLHRFYMSDDDRGLHDHRGDNRSWLLEGSYLEHLGFRQDDGTLRTSPMPEWRKTGEVITRKAEHMHRVELIDNRPVTSLFFIGPTTRDWGFWCDGRGWVPWQDFVSMVPGGNDLGKGCG